jgi:AcrR family transcriptional regulator
LKVDISAPISPDPEVAPRALTPKERRERNRREMVELILSASRSIMQEHGVAALNLNEVARRVHLKPQSLAEYFSSKAALYGELQLRALHLFLEGDRRAYEQHEPGWKQIEAWLSNRFALAIANPDLYHLAFDAPIPDYQPLVDINDTARAVLDEAGRMVNDAVATGVMEPGMPPERALDLLLAIRHGLIAERIGKQAFIADQPRRFSDLIPEVMRLLRAAWAPTATVNDVQGVEKEVTTEE